MVLYEDCFKIIGGFGKGIVRQSYLVNESVKDYPLIKAIAIEKAMKGAVVDIMPILHINDPLRHVHFFDAKYSKNPDLRIDGVLYEVEQPAYPNIINNLKHRIDAGAGQADHVIIDLIESVTVGYLYRVSKGRLIDHDELKVIEFRYQSEYIVMRRTDIL